MQFRGEAPPERQITTVEDRKLGLVQNLGGYPGEMLCFASVLGPELG